MKKIVVMLLGCLILTGCSNSGITQEQYESVVAERDALTQKLESLEADVSNIIQRDGGKYQLTKLKVVKLRRLRRAKMRMLKF